MEGAAVRPQEPAPSEGYVVSFVAFHERRLEMLPSRFMRVLLHYYKVEMHHLAPNSISQAAIFAAVCEGYLGWSHTGTYGSTSSRQSTSPRMRASEEYGARCMQGAAPFKSEWVEVSSTSRRSSSRRTADGTTGGSSCVMTTTDCRGSPAGS
jgi:hypothetical protein